MQIIIIQTEIEEAIRNHILSQITIREDQRIDIDLRATRGSDGFQAVIDIVADTTPMPVQATARTEVEAQVEVKPTTAPAKALAAVRAPSAKTVKVATPAAVKAAVQAPPAEDDTNKDNDESDILPDAQVEEDTSEQPLADGDQSVADIAAETSTEDAPVPTKKTSLFANMKKPDNA